MERQKRLIAGVLSLIFFVSSICSLNAQTSSKSSSKTSSGTSRFSKDSSDDEDDEDDTKNRINSLLTAYIIGGMLRHPDPNVRKQAIQSLAKGLSTSSTSDDNTNENDNSIRSRIFGNTESEDDDSGTNIGAIVYVPDLYVLLADPDPEVRDLASAGLDIIMGTDTTLLRMMSDPEPLIRNYATKIYAARTLKKTGSKDSSNNDNENQDINQLMALRTLLVRLKYETNMEVRKTITDAIEWYIKQGAKEGETTTTNLEGMFGVPDTMIKYLDDPNPELRKNAIRVISRMDVSYDMLIKFMERLRIEEDEGVKKELQTAIDSFAGKYSVTQRKREGTIPME